MHFEIIGAIESIKTIAVNKQIREIKQLRSQYGAGRWRKRKGRARVRLSNNNIRWAEVHWYEANGVGKKKMKIKQFLDQKK